MSTFSYPSLFFLSAAGQCLGIYGEPLQGVAHLIKREEWEAVQQSEGVGNPKSG